MNPAHSVSLRRWLAAPGSLSRHLAALGSDYRVRPLREGGLRLLPDEGAGSSRARSQRYWGREVLLYVNGQPLVFARSFTLARAVRGPWRALRRLGTRPLADLLFGVRPAHREVLPPLRLPPASPWHSRVGRALRNYPASPQPRLGVLWMRRALFAQRRGGPALMVQEVFLPAISRRAGPGGRSPATARGWATGPAAASHALSHANAD